MKEGAELELDAVSGSDNGDGGIVNGALLSSFAEAVHHNTIDDAGRARLVDAVGPAGLVDAAAICANFNMMVRIADGTGTPLDDRSVDPSDDLRNDLGLNDLTSKRLMSH